MSWVTSKFWITSCLKYLILSLDIEIKYPGLQDKVKQRVLDIVNKAKNVGDLIKKAIQEIIMVGGENANTIKQIFKDLIANIKNIVSPKPTFDAVAEDEIALFDYDLIKQKIKECKNAYL